VFRDFAVVVKESVRSGDVKSALFQANEELIADVAFQSVYRGPGVAEGRKSLAYSVTMRHGARTLSENEIRSVEESVWTSLAEKVGGVARA
jgi:phenylalanyl-tRNA synthetase beta chain